MKITLKAKRILVVDSKLSGINLDDSNIPIFEKGGMIREVKASAILKKKSQ